MKLSSISWLALVFGILFGLWLAADAYVGFYLGFEFPVRLGLIGSAVCLIAILMIATRNWKSALLILGAGLLIVGTTDRLWKYAIHPTDEFKLAAVALLFATPLIAALGAVSFWRIWQRNAAPARSESRRRG